MNLKHCCPVWAISDGLPGHRRQALALASALGQGQCVAFDVTFQPPWSWLSPRLAIGAQSALRQSIGSAWESLPALAIGCGRQAALATRLLRQKGVPVVQILHPRVRRQYWDVLVVPEHDQIAGDHVIQSIASLHSIDDAWLARARSSHPALGRLPQPRVALLLGGPTRQVCWSLADLLDLTTALTAFLAREKGSLMSLTSRRTPPTWGRHVALASQPYLHLNWAWGQATPNPFAGVLAWADLIVASSDSANLLAESCATHAPVIAAFSQCARGRFAHLIGRLNALGRILTHFPAWPIAAPVQPLRETAQIAQKIATYLGYDRNR